jgi:hypothetical protein
MTKYTISVECEDVESLTRTIQVLTGKRDVSATENKARATETVTSASTVDVDSNNMPFDVGAVDSAVDSDGMSFDPELHAGREMFNKDGTWRAKHGKSAAEKAARVAFRAGGGDIAPVADEPVADEPVADEPVADEPVADEPVAPALPGMDVPIPTEEPVSFDRLSESISAALKNGKVEMFKLPEMYLKATSTTDIASAHKVLQTNETARAALLAMIA